MLLLTHSLIDSLRTAGCVFAEQEADLLLEAATSPQDLSARLAQDVRPGDLVLTLGAGDIRTAATGLLTRLNEGS